MGDVYLLHPFMLHSASRNVLREVRIITNPPVSLKEPFNYNRADGRYSLIEQKTLRDLGRPEGLPEWRITGEREMLTPARVQVCNQTNVPIGMIASVLIGFLLQIQADMRRQEMERLQGTGDATTKLAQAIPLDSYYPA